MEQNVDEIMQSIGDWGRIIFYLLIAVIVFFAKGNNKKRKKGQAKQFDFPNADPESVRPVVQPATEAPKPRKKAVKRPVAAAATDEKRYFTYENATDFQKVTAERKEQTIMLQTDDEEQGSTPDFDLRTAVIASEILKPKFEEY